MKACSASKENEQWQIHKREAPSSPAHRAYWKRGSEEVGTRRLRDRSELRGERRQGRRSRGRNQGRGRTSRRRQADVANAAGRGATFKQTLDTYGRVDVVVNNAGIMPLSPIAKGDVATFDKVMTTNFVAHSGIGTGGSACFRRRPHHRLLKQRSGKSIPDLRRVHRFQGWR